MASSGSHFTLLEQGSGQLANSGKDLTQLLRPRPRRTHIQQVSEKAPSSRESAHRGGFDTQRCSRLMAAEGRSPDCFACFAEGATRSPNAWLWHALAAICGAQCLNHLKKMNPS